MKTFCRSILFLALAVRCAAQPATNAPARGVLLTPEYLGALTEEMRTNHPALSAARERTNAAAANLAAVRTWSDPTIRAGGMGAREEMRADEGDILYGVEQKLPLFGKPALARNVARAELATDAANADYQFQIQRSELAKAAFGTALADEVVAIGEQDLAWLTTITDAVESKYRGGQATLIELLQVQNERSRRETQLQTDRDQPTDRKSVV